MIVKSFDGTRISYKIKRKDDLFLVFLHGWANDWTTWKNEIEFFQKKGYSTLTLDLRGHGQSDKPESKNKYSLECFAKDLHEIIEKEDISNFVLIGHSMGGIISLMYYKLFKKENNVRSLVLCDTTYKNILAHKKVKILLPFVKHVLDFIIKNKHINQKHFSHIKDSDLSQYKKSSDYFVFYHGLYNTPMKSVFACLESMLSFNLKNVLPKIKTPVLIIEGEEDKLLPKIDSMEMYHEIKGAEIDFVPKGKHFVNIQNPKLVDKYIFNFLSKHSLKPGPIKE
tara:strand:+ start:1343 stop:2188 length:846 start_codon:yes stop_codon:yes gene_type:complete